MKGFPLAIVISVAIVCIKIIDIHHRQNRTEIKISCIEQGGEFKWMRGCVFP